MSIDLTNTEKVLDNQLKAMLGKTEGREASAAERKTITTLEDELRAIREEIATKAKTEDRAALLARVATEGKVVRTFGNDSTPSPVAAREATENSAEVRDFRAMFRTEERAFTSASTSAGSAVVPSELVAPLAEKTRATYPILSVATHFGLAGGNSVMRLPVKLTHSDATISDDFTTARTALNTTATFAEKDLTCIDYFTIQLGERHWLQSTPGGEDLVTRWVIEDLYDAYASDLATGDGSGNAPGLFTDAALAYYADNVVYTNSDGALTAAAFVSAYTALHPKHRASAKWLMSGSTIAAALALDAPNTSSTTPLVTTDANGVSRILGIEVLECTDAPALAEDSISVALLAPEGYATGTHMEPEVNIDMLTAVPMVKFNGLARLGGQFWNPEAAALIVAGSGSVS